MKIKEIEKVLKEIREREDFLIQLRKKEPISTSYVSLGMCGGNRFEIYELNEEEKQYLKASCITEIKRLKESIECLTD